MVKNHVPYTAKEINLKNKEFTDKKLWEMEIGCGTGEFIVSVANQHREKNFIGLDWALPCLQRAIKKADQFNLNNVLFYHGSAFDGLKYDFKDFRFNKIMINFPDPWPKKKHWKRRIVSTDFLKIVKDKLLPNGELITITDLYSLFLYHNTLIEESNLYFEPCENPFENSFEKREHSTPYCSYYKEISKYQRKNLSGSKKVFYTHHRKRLELS